VRHKLPGLLLAAMLIGLVSLTGSSGCGEGKEGGTPEVAPPKASSDPIKLTSSAVSSTGAITSSVRCDSGSWLPLEWGALPPGTAEVVLYVGRYSTVTTEDKAVLTVPSAVVVLGLDPSSHRLKQGPWPAGAKVVRYRPESSCPQGRGNHGFLVRVFALPERGAIRPQEVDLSILVRLAGEAVGEGRLLARY
jgi:hypothetical protein